MMINLHKVLSCCYPASMVNLVWFANEKYRVSSEQHGDMKSGVSWSKNSTFS